jgi:PadR family transcriptional regulator, regulatory protein PadR
VRRKPGSLVPLELAICDAAVALRRRGVDEFHGYEIAKRLSDAADTRLLTAYGTLYRALGRLEKMGLVESRWEDPQIAAQENRPGRRFYRLTAEGEAARREARKAAVQHAPKRARRRLVPA